MSVAGGIIYLERSVDMIINLIKQVMAFAIILSSFVTFTVTSSDYIYQSYEREDGTVVVGDELGDSLYENMIKDLLEVQSINQDAIAWINVPNIGYYPIFLAEDNTFYLRKNKYKEYSSAGSLFMNARGDGTFDDVALIHGHRMNNGSMFGSLSKYNDSTFYNNNDTVTVFDGYKFIEYKPFTVYIMDDSSEDIKLNILDTNTRNEYYQELQSRTLINKDQSINLNTRLLFLSTCDYSIKTGRLVVGFYSTGESNAY